MESLITDEGRMLAMGAALAQTCPADSAIVYLIGDLGAGKTTLARGFMRGLGYSGPVKSPTYTLLESYEIAGRRFHHFDLYRLADANELDYLGIRDCLDGAAVLLIEWPDRGGACLPPADVLFHLDHVPSGRQLQAAPRTARGTDWLARLDYTLQSRPV